MNVRTIIRRHLAIAKIAGPRTKPKGRKPTGRRPGRPPNIARSKP